MMAKVEIVRILEVIFNSICIGLIGSAGYSTSPFWTYCLFTWCFCLCVTFLILLMEVTKLSEKLPINWEGFISFYVILATLMVLAASIIFPIFFTCPTCGKQIGCTVISFLAFILYATEAGLVQVKQDEDSGFLSTVPGLLKVLEIFVACIIFVCLADFNYHKHPGLQWCVSVYSICLIFALIVIIFDMCRGMSFPSAFKIFLIGCNVLAVLMYMTAVVVWPVYTIRDNPKPSNCTDVRTCSWNNYAVISFMSCVNLVAYIVDTGFSFGLDLD